MTCYNLCVAYSLAVPETRPPHEHDLTNNFWHEFSSPNTESSDENMGETTTHVHEPFFEENSTQINATTQLGNEVYLHCRVNDLREKMVRKVFLNKLIAMIWKIRKEEKVLDVLLTPELFGYTFQQLNLKLNLHVRIKFNVQTKKIAKQSEKEVQTYKYLSY